MRRICRHAGWLLVLHGAAALAAPLPVQAFFSRPAIGAVALSPSGKTLAATLLGARGRMELAIADLDQQPLKFRTAAWLPDYDVGEVNWINERRMVFQAYDSQAGEYAGITGLWAVDADGENGKLLIDPKYIGYRLKATKSSNVLPGEWTLFSTLSDGSDDVLIAEMPLYNWRTKTVSLARLNTRMVAPLRLTSDAPDGAYNWIVDSKGVPRWVESLADMKRHVFQRTGDRWQEVASSDATRALGWGPRFLIDDQLFVAVESGQNAGSRLALFDAGSAAPAAQPILAAPGFDVGDNAQPLLDQASGRLLGWRYTLDSLYTRWIDETMAKAQLAIDAAVPDHINVIDCDACLSAKRWLVTSVSDRDPTSYSLFEPATGRLQTIGSPYPQIIPRELGARSFHRIKARDGADLPLYLTLPAGPAASSLAAVVLVHGGPQSRNRLEFSRVAQFLASRGYVVIEPEFRGSAGYGTAHRVAGWRQWGLAMQDDLQDALQWAVAKGWVDGKRACIMGASYGGYAALMGAVRHPQSYRCAISWVGVTDLPGLLKDQRFGWRTKNVWDVQSELAIGDPKLQGEQLKQTSPVFRAADIHVPVLAAWGKDDQRVPIEQGRDFRDAARRAGVELEYVEYADEGHNWLKPETSIDFFTRVEKLLSRTIGSR